MQDRDMRRTGEATSEVERGFLSPGKEYRPAPFWSWNGRLTPERVKQQIELLHEQGFGGFFMHSRVGLISPYLGDEWMSAVAASVEAARKLDMEAWLYDEDKWPSGFAGGIVPALAPEYRQHGLRSRLVDLAEVRAKIADKLKDTPGERVFIYELQWSEPGRLSAYRRLNGVTDALRQHTTETHRPESQKEHPDLPELKKAQQKSYLISEEFTMPAGDEWYNGECYVDLLDGRATQAFLAVTHEAYRKVIGKDFGPHVPGIFTDEPNFRWPLPADSSPWTPSLPQVFQELHGFDLLEHLPLLFFDGEAAARIRYCYWRTLLHLFLHNFTIPYSRWCEENGIAMTGHYLEEDSLVSQATCIGAAMPHYIYQHVPGIDHLGRNIDNPWTLKQVSSVAHQTGKTRVLCEIFGTAGHSMSFADQKWIADFHFALGVNFMNQHLTLYSMTGERKRDYPANISWAQPYWPYYRVFNDYAARAAFFTSQGKPAVPLLLIHPICSAWALLPAYIAGQDRRKAEEPVRQLDERFRALFSALLAHQRDFDLGDETIIARMGAVKGGEGGQGDQAGQGGDGSDTPAFVIGRQEYRVVVVPPVVHLERSTLRLLVEFARRGGPVILMAPVPEMVSGERDPQAWQELISLPSVCVAADIRAVLDRLDRVLPREIEVLPVVPVEGDMEQQSTQGTQGRAERAGQKDSPTLPILYNHRRDGHRHYYFLASTDRHQAHRVRLRFPCSGTVWRWDLLTGEVVLLGRALPELEWEFAPAGSLCLTLDAAESSSPASTESAQATASARTAAPCYTRSLRLSGPWEAERLHPNILVLDFCRLAWGEADLTAETPLRPVAHWREEVLRASGRRAMTQPYIYLSGKLPYRPLPVVMEFPFYSSVNCQAADTGRIKVKLVVEQLRRMRVTVNGQLLDLSDDAVEPFYWDPDFEAVDITNLIREGENRIRLEFLSAADGPEVEEIYLAGDFQVRQDQSRYPDAPGGFFLAPEPSLVQLAAGDWGPQGYPFYSGTFRYRIPLPADMLASADAVLLRLVEPAGASLFAVRVDGQEVAVLPWEPWEVDLTRPLKKQGGGGAGSSRLIEIDVVSSLRNSLGPLHHRAGDNLGWTGPYEFRPGPHWTDHYRFAAYGLTAVELLTR
ncbi:MAG: hypothetical protein IMX00_07890 [Limnochordales bacterium]|nr:hypothetical protein [Limnochordales bacterium]